MNKPESNLHSLAKKKLILSEFIDSNVCMNVRRECKERTLCNKNFMFDFEFIICRWLVVGKDKIQQLLLPSVTRKLD